MKKQLLLFAALCLAVIGANAQGTWIAQASGFPSVSTGVFNISVCDSQTVWISSYDGSGAAANFRDYSMTIDGGATWIPGVVPAPAGHAWSMIFGLDASTAWAMMYNATAGTGGGIWKTTDGGVNWNQQGVGTIFNASSFPNVVYFWDANVGFTMGDPNPTGFEIYTTADGGTTWVPVPSANIPVPLTGEFGIVDHFEVVGNTVWFDTNKGRVYKSIDQGATWTVSSTGLTVPANNAIDLVFYDANNGLARLYNNTSGANTIKRTSDGGATWTTGTSTGNMFGNDIDYVPGTTSRIVSTGAAAGFIGSSYSDDGGLTWIDIETAAQRTALGVYSADIMWAGGFTTSPTADGIFKYSPLAVIVCNDPSVSSGISSSPDSTICFNDTLLVSTIGAVSPTVGIDFGWAMIISSADISFNNDPLNDPSFLGGTNVIVPAATQNTILPNNGSIFPAGIYYLTSVVFGNATSTGPNVFEHTLDPTCTFTGQSVMIELYDVNEPSCFIGLNELNGAVAMHAFQVNQNQMQVEINSGKQANLNLNVFDITGRLVLDQQINVIKGNNSEVIDIASLNAGPYVIRISDNSGVVTSKFIRY